MSRPLLLQSEISAMPGVTEAPISRSTSSSAGCQKAGEKDSKHRGPRKGCQADAVDQGSERVGHAQVAESQ